MAMTVPTISGGLPLLGHAADFFRSPVDLLRRGYRENGHIYGFSILNRRFVVIIGPELQKNFFRETDKTLDLRRSMPFFHAMFSKQFYSFAPWDEYMRQRGIIMPRFKGEQLRGYVPIIAEETQKLMDRLGAAGEFDLVPTLGKLVMDIAAHSFLGRDFVGRLGTRDFFDLFRKFSGAMDFVLPQWFPAPRLIKAKIAKRQLHQMLQQWIEQRRAHPIEPADFFQNLVAAHYEDGTIIPDEMIRHLILLLVWAGHETTAGHISWALIDLLQNPQYLQCCRAETDAILGGNSGVGMDWQHARDLVSMELALKETERLHPVAFMQTRVAEKDLELDGFRVPRDSFVVIAPCVAHRVTQMFPEPDAYKPERFSSGAGEQGPESGTLIGFGGGFHRCAGVNFARLEMRIALSMLVKHYDFELLGVPRPREGSSTYWPAQINVRYQPRRAAPCFASTELPVRSDKAPTAAAAPAECPFHSARA
jgi:sterol 14alpha-demethylase